LEDLSIDIRMILNWNFKVIRYKGGAWLHLVNYWVKRVVLV
jgi:hypothetical protein